VRPALLAAALAVFPLLATTGNTPAAASMERLATIEGRLVMLTAQSVGVLDDNSGKVVHFMLEAPFEEVYRTDEKTLIPLNEVRINSRIRIVYDQSRGGPRRADRIIVNPRPSTNTHQAPPEK
jgi:hypothetical protein